MKKSDAEGRLAFLEAAFEASPDMISVSSLERGAFLMVNGQFVAQSGWSREEALGKTSIELGLWAEPAMREVFIGKLGRSTPVRGFEVAFRTKAGELRRFCLSAALVELGDERLVVTIFHDVTEERRAAEALRKSSFLLERAEEMAKIGSWEFDYATKTVTGSDEACRIYGVARENLSVPAMEAVPLPEYRSLLDQARNDHILRGIPYDIEFKIKRASDGAILDIHSKASWDGANKRLFGIIRDITEEKRVEEGLKRALAERDTLISELLHRINNTLQVVISLIGLEEAAGRFESIPEFASRVSRRIRAMSIVHRSLAEAKDLSRVELGDFLPRIAEATLEDSGAVGRVRLETELEPGGIVLDAAVPLGIIVGELLDNAFRHALPGGRAGTVRVSARRGERDRLELRVSDDGIGLPSGFRCDDPGNIGLRLASTLAERQLGGSLEPGEGPGCSWRLSFESGRFKPRV